MLENESAFAASEFIALDRDGAEVYVAVVRAAFTWGRDGSLAPAGEQPPVRAEDAWDGMPGISGLLAESDLVPPKPRVDVLLEGKMVLPAPAARADVALQLGARRKAVTVLGDRFWLPGVMRALTLSEPRPFQEMPFEWARAFGGADPDVPKHVERRNPAGRGMRNKPDALLKQPGPNFEDPRDLVRSWSDRPAPVGFGPMARHWEPRVSFGGTYDERWRQERFPLLPADFDDRFYNSAPPDQQLDAYQPGLELRLEGMTPTRAVALRLPRLDVTVTFVDPRGREAVVPARPDTVIVEPADSRLCVVARATRDATPDPSVIRRAVVRSASFPAKARAADGAVAEVTP